MDEQLAQVIKQLESWSENPVEISLTVEIGFFILEYSGGQLVAFEDMFIFQHDFCRIVFRPARCTCPDSTWQEIGSKGYWIVRLGHPSGLITLYETPFSISPHECAR
jgi:hypothetical protein